MRYPTNCPNLPYLLPPLHFQTCSKYADTPGANRLTGLILKPISACKSGEACANSTLQLRIFRQLCFCCCS